MADTENEIKYPLGKKELEVTNEARQEEINASSFYNYLNFCFANFGSEQSADWAYNESKNERSHYKKLSDYLLLRGYEPEMPAIAEPHIGFTDMKSGFTAALNKELELTEKYEEWIDILKDENGANMTLQLFREMLDIQKWAIEELRKIVIQISSLEQKEDQLEWDKSYFAPKPEVIA